MIRLRQKDIERLAIITDGSVDYLTKLVSMSLIDHSYAVDQLIKYSYKKLKSEKRYIPAQMIEALMREYGASKSKVQNAIYNKRSSEHYCSECMKKISVSEYKRNDGLCDSCFAKHIQIDI